MGFQVFSLIKVLLLTEVSVVTLIRWSSQYCRFPSPDISLVIPKALPEALSPSLLTISSGKNIGLKVFCGSSPKLMYPYF